MPLTIIKSDLASVTADAIVYADTKQPLAFFNFNAMLYDKKGRELLASREAILPLVIGEVKLDPTLRLSSQQIIHTSAPVWHGGNYHEEKVLRSCYQKIFQLVTEKNFSSVALPIIGADCLGYPKKMTQHMAFSCIQEFLAKHPDITVFLVVPNLAAIMLPGNRYSQIRTYLNKYETAEKNTGSNAGKSKSNREKNPQTLSSLPEEDCPIPNRKELILRFCQSNGIQDSYEINQILFRFGEEQLES